MILTNMKTKLLKIGELAKASGETVATIRFWTQQGLLEVADKTQSGYQLYNADMVACVKKIRKLKDTNRYTIEGIKKELGVK